MRESSKCSALCRVGTILTVALLLGLVAPARADEPVLVSNIEHADHSHLEAQQLALAQGFVTGGNLARYTLASIEVHIERAVDEETNSVSVRLLADNGSQALSYAVWTFPAPGEGLGSEDSEPLTVRSWLHPLLRVHGL